ncbi:MAG: hypothetical protein QXI19_06105 [Candidatus Caldarchaeum sp.]
MTLLLFLLAATLGFRLLGGFGFRFACHFFASRFRILDCAMAPPQDVAPPYVASFGNPLLKDRLYMQKVSRFRNFWKNPHPNILQRLQNTYSFFLVL